MTPEIATEGDGATDAEDTSRRQMMLIHQGYGLSADALARRIGGCPDLVVIDRTRRMLVIEGPSATIGSIAREASGWTLAPVRTMRRAPLR